MYGKTLSQKIVKNTFFSFVGTFWMLGISLILTPYIIYKIGLEKFGIWAISASIVGFLGLFNLGTSSTYTKYIAEHYAVKNSVNINRTINTGLAINLLLGLCMSFILFFITPIVNFFKFNPAYLNEIYFVVRLSIIIFIVVFISGILDSVINGIQRMDISNKINIFISLLSAIGVIIFLQYGWGLRGLVINSGIMIVISIIIKIICSFRLLPDIRFSIRFIKLSNFKQMIKYGTKIQVSRIANFVNGQVDKILLGHFLGMAVVGYYDIGAKLTRSARQVLLSMNSAILPVSSELNSVDDKVRIRTLYTRASKYLSIVAIPLLLFTVTFAPIIINFWVGPGYDASVFALRFLMVGFMVNNLTGIGTSIVRGIGKPHLEMKYEIWVAVTNVFLSLILIIKMGFIGALIGTSLSLVIFSIYFMIIFHKEVLKDSFLKFAKETYFIPFMLSAGLCLLVHFVNLLVGRNFDIEGRMAYFLMLLIDTLIFGSLYVMLIFKLRFLNTGEAKTIIRHAFA
ncbi:flippase [Candidatus Omnitrophota bacterium]